MGAVAIALDTAHAALSQAALPCWWSHLTITPSRAPATTAAANPAAAPGAAAISRCPASTRAPDATPTITAVSVIAAPRPLPAAVPASTNTHATPAAWDLGAAPTPPTCGSASGRPVGTADPVTATAAAAAAGEAAGCRRHHLLPTALGKWELAVTRQRCCCLNQWAAFCTHGTGANRACARPCIK